MQIDERTRKRLSAERACTQCKKIINKGEGGFYYYNATTNELHPYCDDCVGWAVEFE